MNNKILVPTDFSVSSENALDVAVSISKTTGWPITLLNVIKSKDLLNSTVETMEEDGGVSPLLLDAKARLEELSTKSKYKDANISIEIALRDNLTKLTEEIASYDAQLIIMGTKTLDGYGNERLVGENTRSVVKEANCPVLVVKKKMSDVNIRSAVFTTNFDKEHKGILHKLSDLFNALGASVHILCVSTPENFITTARFNKKLADLVAGNGIKLLDASLYNDVSRGEGILNFSKQTQCDLLVMPTHGRKGLDLFFNGSVAENTLDHYDGLSMTIFHED